MNLEHVHLTAVLMPFGLYEWLVMPMGLCNAPAIHQQHVTAALHEFIGCFCHIYLDNIVIWLDTLEEHYDNIRKVLQALCDAQLYVNMKCHLYCTEIDFLRHHISANGIKADASKVDCILNWPALATAKQVQSFLGLVQYISVFLPCLAEYTSVLHELTTYECDLLFLGWTKKHQHAFDMIKQIVIS